MRSPPECVAEGRHPGVGEGAESGVGDRTRAEPEQAVGGTGEQRGELGSRDIRIVDE